MVPDAVIYPSSTGADCADTRLFAACVASAALRTVRALLFAYSFNPIPLPRSNYL
jgi:hypothetical protein